MSISFPGFLFSAAIVVETMEAEKRDPGNEVVRKSCGINLTIDQHPADISVGRAGLLATTEVAYPFAMIFLTCIP